MSIEHNSLGGVDQARAFELVFIERMPTDSDIAYSTDGLTVRAREGIDSVIDEAIALSKETLAELPFYDTGDNFDDLIEPFQSGEERDRESLRAAALIDEQEGY